MADRQALARSIVARYLTMHRYQRRASHRLRKTYGMGGRGISVLHLLVDQGPHSVGAIARHLAVRSAAVSPMLDSMAADGWVTRCRSREDARRVLVSVTDKGRALAAEAPHTMVGRWRRRLPDLSEEQLLAIDTALERLMALADVDAEEKR